MLEIFCALQVAFVRTDIANHGRQQAGQDGECRGPLQSQLVFYSMDVANTCFLAKPREPDSQILRVNDLDLMYLPDQLSDEGDLE